MTQPVTQDLLARELVGTWALDRQSTTVRFTHKTMWGLVTVRGTFAVVEGTGQVDPAGVLTGALTVSADSIDTSHKKRDEHLRSADFLDTAKYPTIDLRFLGGVVADAGVQLQSELTVKGISEPLTLLAVVRENPADTIAISVETTVDRDRYGMSWNKAGMMKGLTNVQVDATFRRAG